MKEIENTKGLGCLFALGQWAGFSLSFHQAGFRIELGWLAITFLPFDGDVLFQLAFAAIEQKEREERLKAFNSKVDNIVKKFE